jgi:hypothetical protein
MNDGVAILLERIKTNPEEFKETTANPFSYTNKWLGLFSEYKDNLPEEDRKAFKEAFDAMKQEEFTAKVMEELLDPKSEQLSLDLKGDIQRAGMTPVRSSVTLNNTNTIHNGGNWSTPLLDPLVQAHIDAHQQVLQKQKKHKTLFGRLFNYL